MNNVGVVSQWMADMRGFDIHVCRYVSRNSQTSLPTSSWEQLLHQSHKTQKSIVWLDFFRNESHAGLWINYNFVVLRPANLKGLFMTLTEIDNWKIINDVANICFIVNRFALDFFFVVVKFVIWVNLYRAPKSRVIRHCLLRSDQYLHILILESYLIINPFQTRQQGTH